MDRQINVTGSGLPLILLWKAAHYHNVAGSFNFSSIEHLIYREKLSPPLLFLHHRGLEVFQTLDLNIPSISAIDKIIFLDKKLKKIWDLPLGSNKIFLSETNILFSIVNRSLSGQDKNSNPSKSNPEWEIQFRCPGIFTGIARGSFNIEENQLFLVDLPDSHIGFTLISKGVFIYLIPKKIDKQKNMKEYYAQEIYQLFSLLKYKSSILENFFWFPIDHLSYRKCYHESENRLFWGSGVLQLHPLGGQWLSHWALVSMRLCNELKSNGYSGKLVKEIDYINYKIFINNKRTLDYYLHDNFFANFMFRIYSQLIVKSKYIRGRLLRNLLLKDYK